MRHLDRTRRHSCRADRNARPLAQTRRRTASEGSGAHHLQPRIDSASLIDLAVAGGHTPLHEDCFLNAFGTPAVSLSDSVGHETPAALLPNVCVAAPASTVELSGKALPTVTLNLPRTGLVNGGTVVSPGRLHASALHVSTTDIFQAYFADKHWDEFKAALEEANVTTRPVHMVEKKDAVKMTGSGEIVDVVTLDQVKLLLARRVALQVTQAGCSPKSDVGHSMRTRQSHQGDISHFEVAGEKVPCIVMRDRQFVRLVDIERRLLQNGDSTGSVTNARLKSLRQACVKLGVHSDKCSPNEKARMVVYANSYRHNSLHVVRVDDLPRIIAYERRRRKAVTSADQSNSTESGSYSTDEDGPKSPPPSPFDASRLPSAAPAPDDSELVKNETQGRKRKLARRPAAPAESSLVSSVASPSSERPASGTLQREDLNLSESEDTGSEEDVSRKRAKPAAAEPEVELDNRVHMCVPHDDDVYLAGEETVGWSAMELTQPCAVALERSHALAVVVTNPRMERGPVGRYLNHLYRCRGAACILCSHCKQMCSVSDFLQHSHFGSKQGLSDARLYMHVHADCKIASARFDLWQRLHEKAKDYGDAHLHLSLPDDLASYHQSLVSASLSARREALTSARRELVVSSSEQACERDSAAPNQPSRCKGSSQPSTSSSIPPPPSWRRKPGGNASETVLSRMHNSGAVARFATCTRRVPIGLREARKEALFDEWYP